MALTWNLSNIENFRERCFEVWDDTLQTGALSPVTDALIWMTMATGIGEITPKTADEFTARCEVWERLHGAYLKRWDDGQIVDHRITRQMVDYHIGLTTNVFPMETRARWMKRIVGGHMDRRR